MRRQTGKLEVLRVVLCSGSSMVHAPTKMSNVGGYCEVFEHGQTREDALDVWRRQSKQGSKVAAADAKVVKARGSSSLRKLAGVVVAVDNMWPYWLTLD